jgi:hypothetical protein
MEGFELKGSLGGQLSKLCVTPPFSINIRCQIEIQVSDYRLLGASSFLGAIHEKHKFRYLKILTVKVCQMVILVSEDSNRYAHLFLIEREYFGFNTLESVVVE